MDSPFGYALVVGLISDTFGKRCIRGRARTQKVELKDAEGRRAQKGDQYEPVDQCPSWAWWGVINADIRARVRRQVPVFPVAFAAFGARAHGVKDRLQLFLLFGGIENAQIAADRTEGAAPVGVLCKQRADIGLYRNAQFLFQPTPFLGALCGVQGLKDLQEV